MKLITESSDHHFLGFLEKIRHSAQGWVAVRGVLARKFTPSFFLDSPHKIKSNLQKLKEESDDVRDFLVSKVDDFANALIYQFADGDLMLLIQPRNDNEHNDVKQLYRALCQKIGAPLCSFNNLATDLYSFQKLSDHYLLGSKRIESYLALADKNRIASIALRRRKRDAPVVMIVEDDRFTATYAVNILNKNYDVIHARTGEEAITYYIDHAPDMVFMDIHLPGISGRDALRAIKTVDPEAYAVMLSVDAQKDNIILSSKEGAAGFLKKPFSKDRLLQITRKSPFIQFYDKAS